MALLTAGVVLAATSVYSAVQQRKAAKATKRSQAAQQRQADLAAARERRKAIRDQRVAQGSIESQAALTGLIGGTAAAGAQANVTSRTNENLSFMDQTAALSQKASVANQQAADYMSKASTAEAIGSLASSAGSLYGK